MATAATEAAWNSNALHEKYLAERDKRLRPDADRQYLAADGEFASFAADPNATPQPRDPMATTQSVVIVGAGFGGLLTAVHLTQLGVRDFLLVDQAADLGGTWYWNRYPGVRCDIESYIYMPLLEEVGTVPSERYATGAEIFAHCQAIGRHYQLYERALLQTRVTRLQWNESQGRWHVTTDRGDTICARHVVVSQGPLAKVKLPAIPGIRRFQGKMFHTSRWDYAYTGGDANGRLDKLADRRVAVIGTGATAVQIVPQLAQSARQLLVFQRTPSAIDERNNTATDAAWFRAQPAGWLKQRRDNFLAVITAAGHTENLVGDRWTDFWCRFGTALAAARATGAPIAPHEVMQRIDYVKMEELRARVDALISDPATAQALKPWYNYLCKRPLYSDDFLQCFARPNVTLVDTDGRGVDAIDADSVVAAGQAYRVDCIIFATGFDVGAPPHQVGGYEVIGRGGLTLAAKWAAGFRSVHGTQLHGFPNFHIVGGTAQGTTAFNFTHTLDMQAAHAAALVNSCLEQRLHSFEVTRHAEDRWLTALQAAHVDHQHFYEECTPGFLNNEGDFKDRPTFVGGTYGRGPIEYQQVLTKWRQELSAADVAIQHHAPESRLAASR